MLSDEHVTKAQDEAHATGHDYVKGSPHLRHAQLRGMIEGRLTALVKDSLARTGTCRVLEVGAGHGTFTECLLAAGAEVTVTEASAASAEHLESQFHDNDHVHVIYDDTGEQVLAMTERWDLAVIVSVLHHIPDYEAFLQRLGPRIEHGGAIFTVQDPLWYPRRSRISHTASRGSYFAWRLLQGDLRRGLASRYRRLRGVYSEVEPSDLVEYHVVRQGCDEEAIRRVLAEQFDVEVFTYWSSQAPVFQRLFERSRLRSDFGVQATGHRRK